MRWMTVPEFLGTCPEAPRSARKMDGAQLLKRKTAAPARDANVLA
jgi:hypothetical protein